MSDLSPQLRALRLSKGLNQGQLGQKLGLPQSHISKIEKGLTDPRLSTLLDMARVLDHELMLVPRQLIAPVTALLHGEGEHERRWQLESEEDES